MNTEPRGAAEPAARSETVADVDDVLTPTISDVADATATPVPIPSDMLALPSRPLPPQLAVLDDVDVEAVLRRGYLMWSFETSRDHGAINDAVYSFLTSADTYGAGGSRVFTPDRIERFLFDGVRAACAADDVEHAWGIAAGVLDMSDAEFSVLVDASCQSYRLSESQPPRFQPQNKTWDEFVLDVLGVGDLTDLIDDICGPAG